VRGWKTAAALLAIAISSALVAQARALPTATAIDATLEERADPAGKPLPALAPGYNLVLVSIDSLRSDHLDAYGYHRSTAPTISELAAEGVLFRNNSSATSWTLPAHMSMLTGRSLLGHGVIFDDRSLTADVPTLAESLQGAGYRTGAVVSAPNVEARYGFDRGFDDYDDRTISFATNGESYKTVPAPLLQKTTA
jgi:arylsulfatase A-like enzyme